MSCIRLLQTTNSTIRRVTHFPTSHVLTWSCRANMTQNSSYLTRSIVQNLLQDSAPHDRKKNIASFSMNKISTQLVREQFSTTTITFAFAPTGQWTNRDKRQTRSMYTTIPIILLVMQAVVFHPFIGISDHTYYLWYFVQCTEKIVCSIQTRQYDIPFLYGHGSHSFRSYSFKDN